MSASPARSFADPFGSPKRLPAYDPRAVGLIVRIAEAIARPIGRSDIGSCNFFPLTAEGIAIAAESPSLTRPLNLLVARQAGFDAMDISEGLTDRLCARPASRLSALLATSQEQTLLEAASRLAAAALHPRIVMMPHKSQRVSLITAFGEDNYWLATREAPLRYTRLGDFCSRAPTDLLDLEGEALRQGVVSFGASIIFAFLVRCEKELAALARLRWPALDASPEREIGLADVHRDLILRLCVRSFPSWSPIIV